MPVNAALFVWCVALTASIVDADNWFVTQPLPRELGDILISPKTGGLRHAKILAMSVPVGGGALNATFSVFP